MSAVATVTFFHHAGLMAAVEDTLLVFDYWRGENGEISGENELTEKDFEGYKQIIVFVSNDDEDHFDPVVLGWDAEKYPITYIFARDMQQHPALKNMQDCIFLSEGQHAQTENVRVDAYGSTHKGVSFYVTAHGVHIFHAGVLNMWHWRDESTLREIVRAEEDFYAAVAPITRLPIDIAMFPVDPRMGGMYDAGANHFVMAVKPRLFIPMHWQNRTEVAVSFARTGHTDYTEILALTRARQRAEVTFGENTIRIHVFTLKEMQQEKEKEKAASAPEVKLDTYEKDDPFTDTDLPVNM